MSFPQKNLRFSILFLFCCAEYGARSLQELKVSEGGEEKKKEKDFEVTQREIFFFEARCRKKIKMLHGGAEVVLFSPAAVSQRPSLAVRGEAITMTASSKDSTPSSVAGLFLLLLLLLPAVCAQRSAVPTTPTPSLFDPRTQPECAKKEHPKVSVQGQTWFFLYDSTAHTTLF